MAEHPMPDAYVDPNPGMQAILREPAPGDSALVRITALQATKCAAIMIALREGNPEYEHAAQLVENFLAIAAIEAKGGASSTSAEELWRRIDAAPWPTRPNTRPKRQ